MEMNRRAFIGGIAAIPFAFLFKKAEAKEIIETNNCVEKPKTVEIKEESICRIDANGDKRWYNKNDKLHRLDGPAVEFANGTKWWCQNGKLHRLDGPAVEYADGYNWWYQNDKLHRIDDPAVEFADGINAWWKNGKFIEQCK